MSDEEPDHPSDRLDSDDPGCLDLFLDGDAMNMEPKDGVTRCEICGKPFIYGFAKLNEAGEFEVVEKHPDPGRCQNDGTWAHNACYEGSR